MKRVFLATTLFALTLILFGSANAGDWIETDTYEAPMARISVDGDASDWAGIKPLTGVKFKTTSDEWVVFEEYGGGTWSGPDDQLVSVAFAWDPDYLYIYISVVDDEHQNSGSGWNGDGAQIVFADGARTAHTQLYNYALNDSQDGIIIDNEAAAGDGLADDDVVVTRDDGAKITFYEARFTPEALGLPALGANTPIGIGICVNDGDKAAGQDGQKGWSGWGPHSAVFGKNGDKTGLVTLSPATAVDTKDKLATTWGEMKK